MFLMGIITMKFSVSKLAAITAGTLGAGASLALLGWSAFNANGSTTIIALIGFGFFNGFFLVGSLTAMMDMTTEEDRGSYMGLWGLAIALANGVASIIGGAMVSGIIESGLLSPEQGYGGIFLLEAALVVYALSFIRKVDTNRLKKIDRDSMAGAMEADM